VLANTDFNLHRPTFTIFSCPPNIASAIPVLMSSWPWMDGAMDLKMRCVMRGSRLNRRISSSQQSHSQQALEARSDVPSG